MVTLHFRGESRSTPPYLRAKSRRDGSRRGIPSHMETAPQSPHAVAIDVTSGKLFVADNASRVLRFSLSAATSEGAVPEAVLGQQSLTDADFGDGAAGTWYTQVPFSASSTTAMWQTFIDQRREFYRIVGP